MSSIHPRLSPLFAVGVLIAGTTPASLAHAVTGSVEASGRPVATTVTRPPQPFSVSMTGPGADCANATSTPQRGERSLTLPVTHAPFVAAYGTGHEGAKRQVTCTMQFTADLPPGRAVALTSAAYDGEIWVPKGAEVELTNDYVGPDSSHTPVRTKAEWRADAADTEGVFHHVDRFDGDAARWSKCGGVVTFRHTTTASVVKVESPRLEDAWIRHDSHPSAAFTFVTRSC